jgi:hypothetical protein
VTGGADEGRHDRAEFQYKRGAPKARPDLFQFEFSLTW